MARARAIIGYVKLDAAVSPIENAVRIIADVKPRIRAVFDYVKLVAFVDEAQFVVTETIWDDGATTWDVEGGVPKTHWDIGLP